jgi:H+/gluconate symporter-like permease
MKEIIDKISSYNLFNYLFPGVIFVIILREVTKYDLIQENNFIGAFLYYFIGLVISRIGSLIIGKILQSKRLKFVKFTKYSEFIFASDKDKKIELFSEINNMYRTLIAVFCCLLVAMLYQKISEYFQIPINISYLILILFLIVIFIFSYQKQTEFIVKRVVSRTEIK